jgi:hypothetical protein
MGKDHIGYDELVDNALRGAMREVLLRVAENGLMGSHHLYVTFRTGFPGVDIPGYLRDRYPDELTIVLQHQFWGLEVTEEDFSVTLSFNKAREHVSVPFAALTRFADPGVKFGMQFEIRTAGGPGKLQLVGGAEEALGEAQDDASGADGLVEIGANGDELTELTELAEPAEPAAAGPAPALAPALAETLEEPAETDSGEAETETETETETAPGEGESETAGAEVVTLDSFRKK